jgi:hypothetical protein
MSKLSSTSLLSRVYRQQVPLTSLSSRVYSQQVSLDKFIFSYVQSTRFPWQVYLLVCTVNKFSLTTLPSCVYSQQVSLDKFTFSCVQSTSFPWQVYFDKFTFSCVQSTSFPWQVYFLVCTFSCVYSQQGFFDKYPLTSLPSRVHGMLLNINLTSRPPNSVCQNHRNFSCTPIKLSLAAVRMHEQIFLVQKLARLYCTFGTRLLGKEKMSISRRIHTRK